MRKLINGEVIEVITEDALQESIIKWRDEIGHKIHFAIKWLHHIPNGGKLAGRNRTEIIVNGVKRKKLGITKGIPDLFLPYPSKTKYFNYNGLYIELKVGDNKQSKEQLEFEKYCNEVGYLYLVKYTKESAITAILNYLNIGE